MTTSARTYTTPWGTIGTDLSDPKRLRQLEEENAKLKRLVADVMLDNVVLKDLLGSKLWDANGPRTIAEA